MRLLLLAVGQRQPAWVDAGYREYERRFPPHLKLQLFEIPASRRAKTSAADKLRTEEGERLLKAIPDGAFVIALDERGESVSTQALSDKLSDWLQAGRDIVLMIGGADGLADKCLQRADWRWSLSPLTLPHGLVRILVAEQLYRANSLLENHPYHRK